MLRVGIIGPESTGKSTLARYLACRYGGVWVPEYAREYVEQMMASGKAKDWTEEICYEDLCRIARKQIAQMDEFFESDNSSLLVFDTELIVTKVWFDYAFKQVPIWLEEAIKAYPMDVYLLTYPDIQWIPDIARSNGADAIRMELFDRYEHEIQALDIPYYIIKH